MEGLEHHPELLARLEQIRALVVDVDGVLTDGSLWFSATGEEVKRFHAKDGYGIKLLQRVGIDVVLLSGRLSPVVEQRAKVLDIKHVYLGQHPKMPAFEEYLRKTDRTPSEIAYMGDDLLDLPVMHRVGLAVAPADAVTEVRKIAHWVTLARGGEGAVRELVDMILKAQGWWDQIMGEIMMD